MGKYFGNKSLDAEILLDLDKGIIHLDYTLNKYQDDKLDSSSSIFDSVNNIDYGYIPSFIEPFRDLYLRLKRITWSLSIYKSKQKSQDEIYEYQKFLEYYQKHFYGVSEYAIEGQHTSKEILYHLENNIWFEYDLEGDYRDKIKTISLKRRMTKRTSEYGEYLAQDGWNLVFAFKGIPMHGKCIIRYT